MRWLVSLFVILTVSACTVTTEPTRPPQQKPAAQTKTSAPKVNARAAARQFVAVVNRMEPVAERECRARTRNVNCDFKIVVDDRPNQPPNAFQTLDKTGRPILGFNVAMIASVRNQDELAFVMAHEASHHIRGHLLRQRDNAVVGAILAGGLATVAGGNAEAIRSAQELGGMVGARSYSKAFELEADELGTVISHKAGYNPIRGAQFFNRIPDPGDRFLGTHPPNAERIKIVRQTAAKL